MAGQSGIVSINQIMKKIATILPTPDGHWVGDGFPVRGMFDELAFTPDISPFLMLDYGGPAKFTPTDARRGVGGHPHKGFETVTIVYQGEVEHRDSVGHHGTIGPGDVQWMTAASGLLHDEFHSRAFAKKGGMFEMVQLWVNLPAKDKKTPPKYQSILNDTIPVVSLENGAGLVRVIAGNFRDTTGAASTFTPINVWDIRLKAGSKSEISVPEGYMTALFVLHGQLDFENAQSLSGPGLAIMETSGDRILLNTKEDTSLLLLNGQPINEPIAARGPFVMNTEGEIREAMMEFQRGKMGQLPE